MANPLASTELTAELAREGYAVRPLLSPGEVVATRAFYDRLEQPVAGGFHATMYAPGAERRRALYDYLRGQVEPRLSELLPGYRVCTTNFMVKEPGQPDSEMRMHQDWSFVDEGRYLAVHAWVPLVDVDRENGCLSVVAGSHLLGDPIRAHADDCPLAELLPVLTSAYLDWIPMRAGEVFLYDGRLLHGSPPNHTTRTRVAFNCILVPVAAELEHWIRVSPEEVEGFQVSEAFFWDYQLFERPRGVPSLGRRPYVVRQRTLDEVLATGHLRPGRERALPAAAAAC